MPSGQSGYSASYCRIPGDVSTVLGPSSERHNILLNADSVLENPSQIRISLWGWWWPLEDGTECLPEALAGYFWRGKSLSTFVDSQWSVNSLSLSHIPAQFTASPSSEIPLFAVGCAISLLHVLPPSREVAHRPLCCFQRCCTGEATASGCFVSSR